MTESVESPERIWIESEGECPYFYHEEELSDVAPPITEYVRADKLEELAAEVEALRAEVERLHRIPGRIVGGDGDSTLTIRAGEGGRVNNPRLKSKALS